MGNMPTSSMARIIMREIHTHSSEREKMEEMEFKHIKYSFEGCVVFKGRINNIPPLAPKLHWPPQKSKEMGAVALNLNKI